MSLFNVCAPGVSGQTWELDLRSVRIDHDPSPNVADIGEQVPAGLGASARFIAPNDHLFVDVEWFHGDERRPGVICGGFVQPGDCILETVRYSAGTFVISTGWLARLRVAPRVRLGVRPRLGIGMLGAHERGIDTGRTHSEVKFVVVTGVAAEAALLPFARGPWISVSTGADALWHSGARCLDCRVVFITAGPLPQFTVSIGLSWYAGS